MQNLSMLELFGYFASVMIVVSLMMKSLVKLRWVNAFGAACMSVYGVMINSYPVAVLNGLIVVINFYYLYRMFTQTDYFKTLEIEKKSKYLDHFLAFYRDEIKTFQPNFRFNPEEEQTIFFVLRNMVPAGIFIVTPHENNSLLVKLDFVIPGYRDFKIGHFVYRDKSGLTGGKKVRAIYTRPGTEKHEKYLRRMGFKPTEGELYCLVN